MICISFFTEGLTKILVATGKRHSWDYSFQIEIIDLEEKEASCKTLQDFPKGLDGAVGGLVDNIPIICGGVDSNEDDSLDCYSLRGNKFERTGQLSTSR